jgi:carboxyl-terminal processing protease
MSPRLKFIHRRQLVVLAALSLTLGLALWADDATPPAVAPAPATDVTPAVPAPAAAPATTLPAGGGNLEPIPDKTKMTAPAKDKEAIDSATEIDPANLPAPKPIVIHAERDAEIGRIVGVLLEENHYLQKPITNEMSQRWLNNYFLALDSTHLFFLQSDIDEFTAKYGNNLGQLLLHNENETTAVAPAFEIYDRYVQRLNENIQLAEKLVHEKFDFTKDESFMPRTDKSAWFKDAAESQAIWHDQVKLDLLNGVLDKKDPAATTKRIAKRYAAILRDREDMDDMDVLEQYLNGLTHAYDPHSDYFQPDAAQDFAIQAINHAVTGIGAVLKSDDGYATIEEVIVGGPADLDKRLQAGDRIIAVGQDKKEPVDVVNMKLNRVVDKIRGQQGTMVHLVVLPAGVGDGGAHKDIILKRNTVSIKDSLAKADIIMHPKPGGGMEKIGVINLHDFYNNPETRHSAASDVATLIQQLKKEDVAGIILDVRSNGGGLLDQAVALTGLFVNHEPVVQVQRYDHYIDKIDTEDSSPIYYGPLMVMVNKASASATEILAAALQDYGRAIIVGDQSTHGKGTVQQLIPLKDNVRIGFTEDPGQLKMTTQKFYRVAGGSTQKKGVVPDIILPSVLDGLKLGETTLPYYLDYDEVPKADYRYLGETADYLPTLRANSDARVAASTDFGYVRQDTEFYKKMQNDPISLNQAQRMKEMADNKSKSAQRKKDLEARKGTRDQELELTLDMVAQNLPAAPPVVKKPKVDPADEDSDGPDLNEEINSPKVDPQLDEAVNILTDYDRMLHDSGSKLVQTAK